MRSQLLKSCNRAARNGLNLESRLNQSFMVVELYRWSALASLKDLVYNDAATQAMKGLDKAFRPREEIQPVQEDDIRPIEQMQVSTWRSPDPQALSVSPERFADVVVELYHVVAVGNYKLKKYSITRTAAYRALEYARNHLSGPRTLHAKQLLSEVKWYFNNATIASGGSPGTSLNSVASNLDFHAWSLKPVSYIFKPGETVDVLQAPVHRTGTVESGPYLRPGTRVDVKAADGKHQAGEITNVHYNGSYDVKYDVAFDGPPVGWETGVKVASDWGGGGSVFRIKSNTEVLVRHTTHNELTHDMDGTEAKEAPAGPDGNYLGHEGRFSKGYIKRQNADGTYDVAVVVRVKKIAVDPARLQEMRKLAEQAERDKERLKRVTYSLQVIDEQLGDPSAPKDVVVTLENEKKCITPDRIKVALPIDAEVQIRNVGQTELVSLGTVTQFNSDGSYDVMVGGIPRQRVPADRIRVVTAMVATAPDPAGRKTEQVSSAAIVPSRTTMLPRGSTYLVKFSGMSLTTQRELVDADFLRIPPPIPRLADMGARVRAGEADQAPVKQSSKPGKNNDSGLSDLESIKAAFKDIKFHKPKSKDEPAQLKREHKTMLAHAAKIIAKENGDATIIVEGHTDSSNRPLSQKRADAVKHELLKHLSQEDGWKGHVVAKGCSNDRPLPKGQNSKRVEVKFQ